jgi:hypothetical protein
MSSHSSRSRWLLLEAFFWLLVIVPGVKVQQAVFRGHIVDENGVPVDNAEVEILSSKETKDIAYSSGAGDLRIPNLIAGLYRLSVTKPDERADQPRRESSRTKTSGASGSSGLGRHLELACPDGIDSEQASQCDH